VCKEIAVSPLVWSTEENKKNVCQSGTKPETYPTGDVCEEEYKTARKYEHSLILNVAIFWDTAP
jgi:hypothetical protein